jgi:hypothetical protein
VIHVTTGSDAGHGMECPKTAIDVRLGGEAVKSGGKHAVPRWLWNTDLCGASQPCFRPGQHNGAGPPTIR